MMTVPVNRPKHNILNATACVALLLATTMQAADSTARQFTVELKPAEPDSLGHVPYVDITLTLSSSAVAQGRPLLKMPLVTSNVETAATSLQMLAASDEDGLLPLRSFDTGEDSGEPCRHWFATRATGATVVHYRAPISDILASRGAAPPIELRSDSGAFSGQGVTFLMVPEAAGTWQQAVRWNLSAMPSGSRAVSSMGENDVTGPPSLNAEAVTSSYFMAGSLHLLPGHVPTSGFFAAWYGDPPYDLQPLMASEQNLYAFYEKFFRRPWTAPYGVFLRENLVNAGGGMELNSTSFVTTFGAHTEPSPLKITLAHEMLHTFVGGLGDAKGENAWYAEGLAVYYARLLGLRAGQISPNEFLDDLNSTAGRYYTDAFISTPNSEIAKNFWLDTRIRVLPYDRGSMYFAVLDGELRSASDGKQSLDDLVLAMIERRRKHLPADTAAWRKELSKHLGAEGVKQFNAMLNGAVMLPQPTDFGPCFTRASRPMRRYELGFNPKVLVEHKRIVRGLIPGSAADRAGVRNGDELTKPIPQDVIQGQQQALLTLELARNGKPLQIQYLPRGETVSAYQWIRLPRVQSSCIY
jgi:predicted metalloprotease with PDZ domain